MRARKSEAKAASERDQITSESQARAEHPPAAEHGTHRLLLAASIVVVPRKLDSHDVYVVRVVGVLLADPACMLVTLVGAQVRDKGARA
jgi:hypothetical protein